MLNPMIIRFVAGLFVIQFLSCDILFPDDDEQPLRELWRVPTGNIVDARPTFYKGIVFVGSWDHKFYAVDAVNGHVRWTFETGGRIGGAPAEVSDSLVYFGSADNYYYAVNIYTGQLAWKFPHVGFADFYGAKVISEFLYVGGENKMYALNKLNGATLWESDVVGRAQGTPTIIGDTVYIATMEIPQDGRAVGYVYALERFTGQELWKTLLPEDINRFGGSLHGTCADQEKVYVGSTNTRVYALRRDSGMVSWEYKTGEALLNKCIVESGTLFIGGTDTYCYAFDGATGQVRWRYQTKGSVENGPPAIEGDFITFASSDAYIYILNKHTGELKYKWENAFDPLIVGNRFYAGGYIPPAEAHFIIAVQIN